MSLWLGGLFCMFAGMMVLMNASQALPPFAIRNKWQGAALGCGVTAVLQSSSAVSCSVCALVQAKKLELWAGFSLLVGANIGTCMTPILTAFGLKTGDGGVLFALTGLLALLWQSRYPKICVSVAGFCLLMWGMMAMAGEPDFFMALAENEIWCKMIAHPLGAWALGLTVTAILQSSSLTVGLLQVYALTAPIPMGIALPFLLGQNIGTTATALLATLHADDAARTCARYHLQFNVLGNLWALPLAVMISGRLTGAATPMFLATAHLGFNVLTAMGHLLWDKRLKKADFSSQKTKNPIATLSN